MQNWDPVHSIGVVSDTHLPEEAPLPSSLLRQLESVDAIIHCGDFNDFATFELFCRIAPTIGVYGNLDDDRVCSHLPEKEMIRVRDFTLGITHGWGPPVRLEKRVRNVFPAVDMVLFGHSHICGAYPMGGTLVLNPGSATCNRDGSKTYARLTITDRIDYQLIELHD